jgi:hypothetical protein
MGPPVKKKKKTGTAVSVEPFEGMLTRQMVVDYLKSKGEAPDHQGGDLPFQAHVGEWRLEEQRAAHDVD